jgi:hypothetical protein
MTCIKNSMSDRAASLLRKGQCVRLKAEAQLSVGWGKSSDWKKRCDTECKIEKTRRGVAEMGERGIESE